MPSSTTHARRPSRPVGDISRDLPRSSTGASSCLSERRHRPRGSPRACSRSCRATPAPDAAPCLGEASAGAPGGTADPGAGDELPAPRSKAVLFSASWVRGRPRGPRPVERLYEIHRVPLLAPPAGADGSSVFDLGTGQDDIPFDDDRNAILVSPTAACRATRCCRPTASRRARHTLTDPGPSAPAPPFPRRAATRCQAARGRACRRGEPAGRRRRTRWPCANALSFAPDPKYWWALRRSSAAASIACAASAAAGDSLATIS
jgi:hypothetical protein